MLILLDRNPLHVDPRCRRVIVTQRILRLNDTPRGLAHPPGERVACQARASIPDTGQPPVGLQRPPHP